MEVSTNLQLTAKAGMGSELLEFINGILPETRAYDGAQAYYSSSDIEDTDKIELFGRWDSKEKFDAYFQYRVETGLLDKLSKYLAAEPVLRVHKLERVF